nr:hypothetical protein [Massilia oculi]
MIGPAQQHDAGTLEAAQRQRDLRAVGDDGGAAAVYQGARQRQVGRTGVDEHRVAGADACAQALRQLRLARQVAGGALLEVLRRPQADRAAVHAPQQAGRIEVAQVAPDRVFGRRQALRQLGRQYPPFALDRVDDRLASFFR